MVKKSYSSLSGFTLISNSHLNFTSLLEVPSDHSRGLLFLWIRSWHARLACYNNLVRKTFQPPYWWHRSTVVHVLTPKDDPLFFSLGIVFCCNAGISCTSWCIKRVHSWVYFFSALRGTRVTRVSHFLHSKYLHQEASRSIQMKDNIDIKRGTKYARDVRVISLKTRFKTHIKHPIKSFKST